MELKKTLLYFALAVLGVMLWHAWQHDYPTAVSTTTSSVQSTQIAQHPVEFAPASSLSQSASSYQATPATLATAIPQGKMITVKTDVIDADINLRGGNLVNAKLSQYPVSLKEKNTPVQILNANNDALYVAQSGLSVADEKTAPTPIIYTSSETHYALKDGENKLVVTLTGKAANGISIEKIFTFTRNDYAINTEVQ